MATGEGPSARFSMAGECLDPHLGGVIVYLGGCNKKLEALDDMYYLHTGIPSTLPLQLFVLCETIFFEYRVGTHICFKENVNSVELTSSGFVGESERDDRRIEKLSLRKQLKLKCQEQQASLTEGN